MLLETSGETFPGRMNRWSQSEDNGQLWMCLVMDIEPCVYNLHVHLEFKFYEGRRSCAFSLRVIKYSCLCETRIFSKCGSFSAIPGQSLEN